MAEKFASSWPRRKRRWTCSNVRTVFSVENNVRGERIGKYQSHISFLSERRYCWGGFADGLWSGSDRNAVWSNPKKKASRRFHVWRASVGKYPGLNPLA